MQNNVILVNENDQAIGTMEKMMAHQEAKLHRAISVFICNTKGEWLLQKRALHKYHSGGLWTNTCCSHPYPGESDIDAATRRLKEEMGMYSEVKELFSFIYKEKLDNELTEHELDHVFIGVTDTIPTINKEEVAEYKYVSFDLLKKDIELNPQYYTVWFKKIYENINEYIVNQ